MNVRLIEINGMLHIPNAAFDPPTREFHRDVLKDTDDALLLYRYPAGDVDTIAWPEPDLEHLRSALFDSREQGHLPGDCRQVELPDGSIVTI